MDSRTTLLLNVDLQPLSVLPLSRLSWKDSIRLIVVGRVTIHDEYDDWVVRSPSIDIKVPSVMSLDQNVRFKREIKFSRSNILLRDMYTCQYCNTVLSPAKLTLDHVVPRHHGGKTKWDNIVSSCADCNHKKSHHDHMKPKNEPYRPNYYDMASKRMKYPVSVDHPSWIPFIGWNEDLIVKKY